MTTDSASAPTGLEFDPESHIYRLDGRPIVNVTGVLEEMGLMPQYPSATREFMLSRGSAVHLATALYDQGQLSKLDDRLTGFVEGWKAFLKDSGAKVKLVEHLVCCRTFQYAGTLDRLLELKGQLAVVDLKAGEPAAAAALQTAAYRKALLSQEGIEATRRMAVRVQQDGSYRVSEYEDHAYDERHFLFALSLSHWKRKKGLR